MARPKKVVDTALVEQLAAYGLTLDEIADAVRCGKSTLKDRFSAHLKKGWAELKTSLKREQVTKALGGNVAMLIWLGKQYLGQSDRQQVDLTGEMTGSMMMAATIAPAPTMTFAKAIVMVEQMKLEMDPEKIAAAEAAELDGAAAQQLAPDKT